MYSKVTVRVREQENGGSVTQADEEEELIWGDREFGCKHVKLRCKHLSLQ